MHAQNLVWPLFAIGLVAPSTRAEPSGDQAALSGDQILTQMDDAMTRAKDQFFAYKLVTEENGKQPRVMYFQVHIKGRKWRRVEFTSPGDIKGMRFLTLAVDQMWVYMPAYKKVRRVASHVRSQGFMGSAYSQDDMAIATYGDVYSAKLLSEDSERWSLELTRRPGQTFPYPKLLLKVRKADFQPEEFGYMNDKSERVKTEVRSDFECQDGLCNPRLMVMTDHLRGDMKTSMIREQWKFNSGIDDSFFTVRSLQKMP